VFSAIVCPLALETAPNCIWHRPGTDFRIRIGRGSVSHFDGDFATRRSFARSLPTWLTSVQGYKGQSHNDPCNQQQETDILIKRPLHGLLFPISLSFVGPGHIF
jgi:hypothetical protein